MLARQIERVKRSNKIDEIVVATSTDPSDDDVELLCQGLNIDCFRGSLDNVLERFYQAAKMYSPSHVVRLTGDCPLIDPEVIDEMLEMHISGGFDYTSNGIDRTVPDGLDAEIITYECLQVIYEKSFLPSHFEHVTQLIHQEPDTFKIGSYKQDKDLSHLRWTVDEKEDFLLVRKIYEALYPKNPSFKTADILAYLDQNPELKTINTMHKCNEGLQETIEKDQQYLNKKKQ